MFFSDILIEYPHLYPHIFLYTHLLINASNINVHTCVHASSAHSLQFVDFSVLFTPRSVRSSHINLLYPSHTNANTFIDTRTDTD